ncbi:hypothetical protein SteCoe_17245 [Stentor coeruleus]|uniref:Uncharacterized protein n=1 Tax=Stentor coeruleus TaxID=5963 RepID=A0A1R2BZL1_9CILI|nr:hypothetical protein SteCoe_17245 [Stentor coeruleus]
MKTEDVDIEFQDDQSNIENQEGHTKQKKSKWGLVRNVLRAISLFKTHEAEPVGVDELISGIRQIPTDKIYQLHRSRTRENSAYVVALKDLRRESTFISCVERGNPLDLKVMKAIMNEDPYKILRDSTHPLALINKRNQNGQTPLYVACKNGNFEAVKLILSCNPDHRLTSLVDGEEESSLEVAVRWRHINIVNELLKLEWPKKALHKARKIASTAEMQKLLKKKNNKIGCRCSIY